MARILAIVCLMAGSLSLPAQGECSYPIIFIHGWNGNQGTFSAVFAHPAFEGVWGSIADTFHAVLNATTQSNIAGADGLLGNADDDVLVSFNNESGIMNSGCVYAINFENFWNQDTANPVLYKNNGDGPSFFDSDGNESSILKQGYALGKMIESVLAANPDKEKVILVGHSMGGLCGREYLQRRQPANPAGMPRWWVDPASADGHKVAKLVTAATPHLGSNSLGNWSKPPKEDSTNVNPPTKDNIPDLASEAVRDLRYSYACGFLNLDDCPGVYLYGGNENDFTVLPFPYWSEDVDCDGDESSPNVTGINISGQVQGSGSDEWDGTYDNPQLPLPDNVRYTWIGSDFLGSNSDGIVDMDRQWLYDGNIPMPVDTVPFRLTDTMMTDLFHTQVNNEAETIVRGLDEGDYPAFAHPILPFVNYAGMAQVRSQMSPDGPASQDMDWFLLSLTGTGNFTIQIDLSPHPNLDGRLDFYNMAPPPYSTSDANPVHSLTFSSGSPPVSLVIPGSVAAGNYYIRVVHTGVTTWDWMDPYFLMVQSQALPVDLLDFHGKALGQDIQLSWTTSAERNNRGFTIQQWMGEAFFDIGFVDGQGNSENPVQYAFEIADQVSGNYQFRLRQWDLNGQFFDSHVIDVQVFHQADYLFSGLYPNPAGPAAYFELQLEQQQTIRWTLLNAQGQQLDQSQSEILEALVTKEYQIPLNHFPAGLYLIRIEGEEFQLVRSFLHH